MTMSQMIKHYKLPMKTHVNFQVMEEEDVSEAYALVTKYLADR